VEGQRDDISCQQLRGADSEHVSTSQIFTPITSKSLDNLLSSMDIFEVIKRELRNQLQNTVSRVTASFRYTREPVVALVLRLDNSLNHCPLQGGFVCEHVFIVLAKRWFKTPPDWLRPFHVFQGCHNLILKA
jgi:hypothetical protein